MIAKEGYPFIIIPLIIGALAGLISIWAALAFLLVALFMAYFFRDPEREIPSEPDIIVSAADGKVTRVEDREEGRFVSVFLSPLDVHINRSPIAGRVSKVEYTIGKKIPATSDNASLVNERNSLTLDGAEGIVKVTQIAGILARRIVCRSRENDTLARGERFGLIKFSSRTDLLIPDNSEVLVKVGDRVIGGVTVIARINKIDKNG